MTRSVAAPLVIGVTEYVDIPAWRILRLRAKIDTGARSSALHVENIRELGSGRVRFDVRLSRSESERRVRVEARIARRGQVRPSSGEPEERIFVAVKVRIGPVEREIELSLVDRGRMIFRMLIGRRALAQASRRRRVLYACELQDKMAMRSVTNRAVLGCAGWQPVRPSRASSVQLWAKPAWANAAGATSSGDRDRPGTPAPTRGAQSACEKSCARDRPS